MSSSWSPPAPPPYTSPAAAATGVRALPAGEQLLQSKLQSLDLQATHPKLQTRPSSQQQQQLAEKQDASWVYMLSPPRSQTAPSARYNNTPQAAAAAGAAEGGHGHGGSSRSMSLQPSTEYRNGATTSYSSSTSPSDATSSSAPQQQQQRQQQQQQQQQFSSILLSNGDGVGGAAVVVANGNNNNSRSAARHHLQHGLMQNSNNNNNQLLSSPSAAAAAGSSSPHHMREQHQRSYRETELQRRQQSQRAEEGQEEEEDEEGFFSSSEMSAAATNNYFSNNRQDMMMVMNSRISEDDVSTQLRKRLAEASIKEAQLISEKRILELRVAELRLAYDQMQQALVDAASKALSYRQDILEENIRLTYAVQLAEQDRMNYVQSLMPLLNEFELQPPVSDAHSMVSYIKILVQRLRSELELYKAKLKDSQYYTSYQRPSFPPPRHYSPPTQSPPFQGNGFEMVPSFSLQLKSPPPTRDAEVPYWERGASSSPHNHDGPIGNNNLQHKDFNNQEQHQNSRALVQHEAMGGQATPTAEPFFSDPEGDEPLPNNQERRVSDFDRFEGGPQLPTLAEEEPTSLSIQEEGDPLPGIEGLTIVGDAVLGGRLTACGHSVNGTSLCIFQWIRQLPDGSQIIIDGAAQPEYMITADDCDSNVAINCVPMDERRRQGELVTVVANDGKWISQDPMMKDQIDSYVANGHASFVVQFQEGTSEESQEPATLVLRHSTYELRRNSSQQVISEKYAADVSIEIPVGGQIIQCIINSHAGRTITLTLGDARMRDAAVLTFRAFLKMFVDEQKKKKHKWLRS